MAFDENKRVNRMKIFVDLEEQKKDEEDSNSSFRDKNREFEENFEFLRSKLSPEVLEAIRKNPKKMDEIIKGLKKRGKLGVEYDVKFEKFASKITRKNKDNFYKQK